MNDPNGLTPGRLGIWILVGVAMWILIVGLIVWVAGERSGGWAREQVPAWARA